MKKYFILLFIVLTGTTITSQTVTGVYRYYMGIESGKEIWIVDGAIIRDKIYPEFLYGGNGQRYRFEPEQEIWIDNTISAAEYRYTLAHELNERNLMAQYGYTYFSAHDSSLRIERAMRAADKALCLAHEADLGKVSTYDCDSLKEIPELPDSIRLSDVYLQKFSEIGEISVWIVDGSHIRASLYPDFGLSGNDLAYYFIPKNEIWIDAQTSCQEIDLSIKSELTERKALSEGKGYDAAYMTALSAAKKIRREQTISCKTKKAIKALRVPDRDTGTGTEAKP
jgi:hypothetical protein